MTHDKDKILLRAKDLSLLILVLTFFGMIVGPLKKVFQLDDVIAKVAKLEDGAIVQNQNLAVLNAHYENIEKNLDQINYQLRRISRER